MEYEYFDLVDAKNPLDPETVISLGVPRLPHLMRAKTLAGQYYGIVKPGLITAVHIFRGVRRDLYLDGNMRADKDTYVYRWKPRWDFEWTEDPTHGTIRGLEPVPDTVFTVLVRLHDEPIRVEHLEGNADGSIEHGAWVREDSGLSEGPDGWQSRYDAKIWSKPS